MQKNNNPLIQSARKLVHLQQTFLLSILQIRYLHCLVKSANNSFVLFLKLLSNTSISIPSYRDKAVEEYYAWHQSKFKDPIQKLEYQKAYDVIRENAITLQLLCQDLNLDFLITRGIKRGAALHVVNDIEEQFQQCKQVRIKEQLRRILQNFVSN